MTPNRSKSGLFETARIKSTAPKSEGGALSRSSVSDPPRAKVTPPTPRAAKSCKQTTPKADPSPYLHLPGHVSRHSVDHSSRSSISLDHSPRSSVLIERSPRSTDSRLSIHQRTPRISTLSDKRPPVVKGSELQAELNAAQEQLKAAMDRLNALENEKARAVEELEAARREADGANHKLAEALAAQRQAEETTEVEKFRVVELEQAGIEAARQKEEAWKEELERLRGEHARDACNLQAMAQELQRLKRELAMTAEAKNAAAGHAVDALKIAEADAEKAAKLSAEIDRLKASLDSKMQSQEEETAGQINKLNSDIEALQLELGRAKESERKLTDMEATIEGLRIDVAEARTAEANARAALDEWMKRGEDVEAKAEEAARSEELAAGSVASATAKLEECNASLRDAQSEISSLKGKVELLEAELKRYKAATEDSNAHLETVKREISESEGVVEALKSEIERTDGDENQMPSNLPALLEEKRRLLAELEASRDDVDKTKRAMEGLASTLQEVSSEASCSRQQLATERAAVTDARAQMCESKSALESMEKRYEAMVVEATVEVERLANAVGGSMKEAEGAKLERSSKEHDYARLIRRSEEEIAGIKEEVGKLASKLVETEVEAAAAKEEGAQLLSRLMRAKSEAAAANEAAKEAKAEVLQLRERLLDKENALQGLSQENRELRAREAAAIDEIRGLSSLLGEETKPNETRKDTATADEKAEDEACVDKTEVCEQPVEDVGKVRPKARSIGGGGEGKELSVEEVRKWGSCKVVGVGRLSPEQGSLGGSFRVAIEEESFDGTSGGASLPGKGLPEKRKKNFLWEALMR